jgi:hypothetical protein
MSSPLKPIPYASLKRALSNCKDILKPCVAALRSVDDPKLEKHTRALNLCLRDCKRVLDAIESNPEQLREEKPVLLRSFKKCIEVCSQINLDIFQKAVLALEDCLSEL